MRKVQRRNAIHNVSEISRNNRSKIDDRQHLNVVAFHNIMKYSLELQAHGVLYTWCVQCISTEIFIKDWSNECAHGGKPILESITGSGSSH